MDQIGHEQSNAIWCTIMFVTELLLIEWRWCPTVTLLAQMTCLSTDCISAILRFCRLTTTMEYDVSSPSFSGSFIPIKGIHNMGILYFTTRILLGNIIFHKIYFAIAEQGDTIWGSRSPISLLWLISKSHGMASMHGILHACHWICGWLPLPR